MFQPQILVLSWQVPKKLDLPRVFRGLLRRFSISDVTGMVCSHPLQV